MSQSATPTATATINVYDKYYRNKILNIVLNTKIMHEYQIPTEIAIIITEYYCTKTEFEIAISKAAAVSAAHWHYHYKQMMENNHQNREHFKLQKM